MELTLTLPDASNPFAALWYLFTHGGFVAVLIAIGYGLFWVYMDIIQTRFVMNTKYILLAIDVPRENEQTPKAVEHLFSHFHGIQKNPNAWEKYRDGYVQPTITLELISVGGYIQYLIRCPAANRDLIEAAIYAQYPNAEISEVEDYAQDVKAIFPNNDYDMWGCEFALLNKEAYPIRTYPLWEHSLTQTFLDPMASILEIMGRLQPEEQIWFQWVLSPTANDSWRKKGLEIINKLIGAKSKKTSSPLTSLANAPGQLAVGTYETITRTLFEPGASASKKNDNDPPSMMLHLPPNVRVVVEAVGMKISKLGFETKFRAVYLAKKGIFTKARVPGILGAVKQYNTMDMNGFKPDKKMKTSRDYFFVDRKVNALKRRILLGYKYRSNWSGRAKYVLNVEELASLWHFPVITVKAPQVKKSEAKRGEPPVALPIGEDVEYVPKERPAPAIGEAPTGGAPPTNLPIG